MNIIVCCTQQALQHKSDDSKRSEKNVKSFGKKTMCTGGASMKVGNKY